MTYKCISDGLMHVAERRRRTPESKFTKFGEEMSIGQTPNHAKFCGYPTRSVLPRYPRSKICAPEKVSQNSPIKVPYHVKFHRDQLNHLGEKR